MNSAAAELAEQRSSEIQKRDDAVFRRRQIRRVERQEKKACDTTKKNPDAVDTGMPKQLPIERRA